MFELRNISEEEALRRACEQNGLRYVRNGKPKEKITLVDAASGKKTIVNRDLDIVKDDKVKITQMPGRIARDSALVPNPAWSKASCASRKRNGMGTKNGARTVSK